MVVVRFGDKYRQWNAAFEAGYAAALGKPIVTLHDPELTHALKEVDRAAMAVAETPEQVVEILATRSPGSRASAACSGAGRPRQDEAGSDDLAGEPRFAPATVLARG